MCAHTPASPQWPEQDLKYNEGTIYTVITPVLTQSRQAHFELVAGTAAACLLRSSFPQKKLKLEDPVHCKRYTRQQAKPAQRQLAPLSKPCASLEVVAVPGRIAVPQALTPKSFLLCLD